MMNKFESMSLIQPRSVALHSPCTEVTDIDGEVREFIPYLIRIMRNEDGIGISANQVGINKAVFITNVPGDHIRIFINAGIRGTRGPDLNVKEGCLSYPGKQLITQRKRHVLVHALNLSCEQFMIDTSDRIYKPKTSALLSVCLQHEIDHMNGIDMRAYL